MCSIGEDDFGDEGGLHTMTLDKLSISENVIDDPEELCKKCGKDKVVVKLNFKEAQCAACFLTYARHKFRAALGSTKIVSRESNVLIVYDGGPESTVLLDMIKYARSQETFKRLHFQPYVLFVNDLFLYQLDEADRIEKFHKLQDFVDQFQFETFYKNLANGQCRPIKEVDVNEFKQAEEEFLSCFNRLKCLTAKQDFLHIKKANVIREAARELNCKFAFTSEISSDFAMKFLTNIALGRGSSVAQDISFCDTRTEDVKIVRPIRDLHYMEIIAYIRLNKLRHDFVLKYGQDRQSDANESIQNLTANFVKDLQTNFSSTVSTVFRTGDKMATATNKSCTVPEEPNNSRCLLCHSNLDYSNSATLFAIEYSRFISGHANANKRAENTENSLMDRARDAVNGLGGVTTNDDNLLKDLCHGCRNISRDFDGRSLLENIL